jgi:DNA-binding XRE family transcriptional regulator
MAEAGADPAYTAAQIGHRSARLTLDVYTDVGRRQQGANARLDNLIRPPDWAPMGTSGDSEGEAPTAEADAQIADYQQAETSGSPESDSNRRPLPYHGREDGFSGPSKGVKGRTLRTSEDSSDQAVSIRQGPNAAQDLGGASLHRLTGRLLMMRREGLGLSKRQLGQRTGISHSTISRIERGRHTPSLRTLERLADPLGVSVVTIGLEQRSS